MTYQKLAALTVAAFVLSTVFDGRLALAQQMASGENAVDENSRGGLEEVIVTAQKRAQNLQEVPIAVTAIGATEMEEARIFALSDVAMRTPGFTVTEYSLGQPGTYIRGVGSNEDGAGGDNSVAVFLNGVYLARGSSQTVDMFDIEQVEILRGPQGTLWGKNATAGTVSITSARPTDRFEGAIEGTVGNLDRVGLKGFVNGSFSDTVSARLAFSYRDRDGHTINAFTGEDMMGENATSARFSLSFVPSEELDVLIVADYTNNDLPGDARIPSGGGAGPSANAAGGGLNNPRLSLASTPGFAKRDIWGISATINWETSIGTFTSVTAYRDTDFDHLADPLGLTPQLFFVEGDDGEDETSKQFSQELRLTNETDKFRWTTGVYFMQEDAKRIETIDPSVTVPTPAGPLTFQSLNIFDQANDTTSYALFADFTFFLSDRVNLTTGLRYSDEKKDHGHTNAGFIGGPGTVQDELFTIDVSESWDAVTGRVVLDFAYSDDIMFYGSAARGFKSGGFQGQPGTEEGARTPFDPEFNLNYEAGMKSTWLDNSLRFNATVFLMDYQDIQVATLVSTPTNPVGSIITTNAGEAEIKGLELDWAWQFHANAILSGMYAYLDTEVTESPDSAFGVVGSKMQNSPENKFSIGVDINFPLGDEAEIRARASYSFTDDFADGNTDDLNTQIPSHEVVDARIAYANLHHGFDVIAWVKNAFDEEYRIQSFAVAGSGFALFAPERTFGLTVRKNFN